MTLTEWFDPKNIIHIEAYAHLQTYGFWPEGFIPDEISVDIMGTVGIINKMADCWAYSMLNPPDNGL